MKKFITAIAFVALSTVSAAAIELGMFSVTAGVATNTGVYGATATEQGQDNSGADYAGAKNKESGVFTDSFGSQFIELGIGQWISVGYEHTPDSLSTPTNVSREGSTLESSMSVDFNDLNTTYLKINLPILTGAYAKWGTVETDLDIKETMGSGSTYKNVSTSGSVVGAGYSSYLGDTGFGIRFETTYLELDNVSTDNGIAKGTTTTLNEQTHNRVDASNIEGLQAKVALTYTFGRN
tara:strand:+ start:50 stop:760 length:711 start_codon:yes stop_codon:yes gene_type:complete